MILEKVPAVKRLTRDEKWLLIEELWQELLPLPEQPPSPEIVALLDARMEAFRRDPATASPWAEVKARWRAARSQTPK
jgi:putative addiction module component (TIGR02574 family)